MYKRLLELLNLVKPRQPHLPQTNVSGRSEQLLCGDLMKHNFSLSKIGICYECKFIKDRAKIVSGFSPWFNITTLSRSGLLSWRSPKMAYNYLLTDKTFAYQLNINPKSEGNRINAEKIWKLNQQQPQRTEKPRMR